MTLFVKLPGIHCRNREASLWKARQNRAWIRSVAWARQTGVRTGQRKDLLRCEFDGSLTLLAYSNSWVGEKRARAVNNYQLPSCSAHVQWPVRNVKGSSAEIKAVRVVDRSQLPLATTRGRSNSAPHNTPPPHPLQLFPQTPPVAKKPAAPLQRPCLPAYVDVGLHGIQVTHNLYTGCFPLLLNKIRQNRHRYYREK